MTDFSKGVLSVAPSHSQSGGYQETSGDLMDMLAFLWAGKWTIALSIMVGASLALGCARYLIEPVYQSETTLVFEPGSDGLSASKAGLNGLSTDVSAINTQIEMIRSHQMMRDLVTEMNLIKDPEFNPSLRPSLPFTNRASDEANAFNATAENVARAIEVGNLRNSHVLTLIIRSHDPKKSAALGNTLASLYVRNQIEEKQYEITSSINWLSQQVATLEQELESQNATAQALNSSLIASEAEELAQRISETKARLFSLEQRQQAVFQHAETISSLPANASEIADPVLNRLAPFALTGDLSAATDFEQRKSDLQNTLNRDLDLIGRQSKALSSALKQLEAKYDAHAKMLADLQKIDRDSRATELFASDLFVSSERNCSEAWCPDC